MKIRSYKNNYTQTSYAATNVPTKAIPICANSDGGGGWSAVGLAPPLVPFEAMILLKIMEQAKWQAIQHLHENHLAIKRY